MIPIPDPSRLFPRRLPPSREPGPKFSSSLAGGLLLLGSVGVLLIFTLEGGAAASKVSPWLSIPGGLLGFGLAMAISEAKPLVLGFIEALIYFCITFIFTDGFDKRDPASSWACAAIVAAAFLWAGFAERKNAGANE